ncbi:MAG: hypothetical protein R3C10_07390 [Pirellulales bacterium]
MTNEETGAGETGDEETGEEETSAGLRAWCEAACHEVQAIVTPPDRGVPIVIVTARTRSLPIAWFAAALPVVATVAAALRCAALGTDVCAHVIKRPTELPTSHPQIVESRGGGVIVAMIIYIAVIVFERGIQRRPLRGSRRG